jgi:MFS superfamily sulfate permease-like transporter
VEGSIILAAISLALVASAETLLCATAVDLMHQGPRTRYDRELAAQGVGNLLCGLLGALPMTGVIVRSAANVQAGGKTRASAILHGFWLLLFVSLLPFALKLIPRSSLAAILVYTGCKLVNPKAVRTLWDYGKSEVAIYAATVIAIVVTNLLTGIMVGVGLALVKLLYAFSHLGIRVEKDNERNRTVLFLEGAATFIRLPKLAAALETVPPSTELHVHFEHLSHIDHACLDLLVNWEKQHEATGGSLVIDWESLTAKFHGETKTTSDSSHLASSRPPGEQMDASPERSVEVSVAVETSDETGRKPDKEK